MTDFDRGFRAACESCARELEEHADGFAHESQETIQFQLRKKAAKLRALQPLQQRAAAPITANRFAPECQCGLYARYGVEHPRGAPECDFSKSYTALVAPASPAVAAWQALPAEHREWLLAPLFEHVRLVTVEGRNWDEPWKHDVVAALAALGRSLAPEAGDADGGR